MSNLKGAPELHRRFAAIAKTEVLVRTIVIHGVANAQRGVHHRTGNLRRTIRPGRITATSGEILAGGKDGVGYARVEEMGRGPLTIRPRNRKVLAWGGPRRLSGSLRTGGRPTNFATVVHQKARAGHPYLVPGLQKAAREQGVDAIVKLWNEAA